MVGRVIDVKPRGDGDADIEILIDRSHARHMLSAGIEDFGTLERDLRAALDSRRPILLVEDFDGAIIDVRDFTPDPDGPLPPLPEPGDWPPLFPPLKVVVDPLAVLEALVVDLLSVVVVPLSKSGPGAGDLQRDGGHELRSADRAGAVQSLIWACSGRDRRRHRGRGVSGSSRADAPPPDRHPRWR